MPIYEYSCEKCHLEFEELVTAGREPTKCPACRSAKLRRKLSVPASPHGNVPSSCAAGDMGLCQPKAHACGSGCCHK